MIESQIVKVYYFFYLSKKINKMMDKIYWFIFIFFVTKFILNLNIKSGSKTIRICKVENEKKITNDNIVLNVYYDNL